MFPYEGHCEVNYSNCNKWKGILEVHKEFPSCFMPCVGSFSHMALLTNIGEKLKPTYSMMNVLCVVLSTTGLIICKT
jgi:hypothetical protein